MKSQVIKRSVVIDGHRTSISLKDAFWSNLKAIARAQGATVAQTTVTAYISSDNRLYRKLVARPV
jgi:predicted DNA-binding ribbon-helix-helix protein